MTTFGRLAEAIGSEIRIKTDEGIYVGNVEYVNKLLQKLTLSRATGYDENDQVVLPPAVLTFHKDEILDFEFTNFPKSQTQPQNKTVQLRKSPAVSQPQRKPTKSIVLPKPQPSTQPPVTKPSTAQNGHSINGKLLSKKPIVQNAVHSNGFADDYEVEASLCKGVSAAKNIRSKDQKLIPEVRPSPPAAEVRGHATNNAAKTSLTNGDLGKQKYPKSAWDRCKYFSDVRTCSATQDDGVPKHYVVIEHIDNEFYEMLDLIRSYHVIGCGFDGVSLGRHGKLCWMQVATSELVIIFDLLAMGCDEAFKSGLKDVLVSEDILKVMHDCRQASDLLFHQFDIQLVNIFDTQVADVMVSRTRRYGRIPKYVRSLATCLKFYLNMTQEKVAFYEIRKASIEKSVNLWHHRPLTELLIETMGLNVRYLAALRLGTLEGMLAEFTMGVDIFLNNVRGQNNEQAAKHVNGELLPSDFRDFDYVNIVESDPAFQTSGTNIKRPGSDNRGQNSPVNPIRPTSAKSLQSASVTQSKINENPVMHNGHASSFSPGSEDEYEYDPEMPELEDIEDIYELDEELSVPELDHYDVQPCESPHVTSVEPVRPGDRKDRFVRSWPKKPFESSDEESGSFDMRIEHFFKKVQQGFGQKTPDISEDLAEPEQLSVKSGSSATCKTPSPIKLTEEKPFVEEPVRGKYSVQPKLRLENVPGWQRRTKPESTHMNITPAGMHIVSGKKCMNRSRN